MVDAHLSLSKLALHWLMEFFRTVDLRGYCIPNQNWACFVPYLKIINIFLEETHIYICASWSKYPKELQNGIAILVGQAVVLKTVKKNSLAYLNFNAIFEFFGQFTSRCAHYFS